MTLLKCESFLAKSTLDVWILGSSGCCVFTMMSEHSELYTRHISK